MKQGYLIVAAIGAGIVGLTIWALSKEKGAAQQSAPPGPGNIPSPGASSAKTPIHATPPIGRPEPK
jgi:hypothetical protein